MSTSRQKKINQLLQEIIAAQLPAALNFELPRNTLITVSAVDITVDLSIAFVYISVFPFDKAEAVMQLIEKESSKIRGRVGNEIGKQLRVVPEFHYRLDDSLDRIEKIDREIRGEGENPLL